MVDSDQNIDCLIFISIFGSILLCGILESESGASLMIYKIEIEQLHQKTNNLLMRNQKISVFVFATRIVKSLLYLNLKF